MTFNGPEAVKRAVMARLGVSIVPAITVADDLKRGHHGAACRAMLVLLAEAFPRAGLR
jgi:hypothetical protein